MAVASVSSCESSTRTSCWGPQRARRSPLSSTPGTGTPTSDDDPSDGLGQHCGVEPGGRRLGWPGPTVGPKHHVEVDEAAGLELDHLDVRQPGHRAQLPGAHAAGPGDLAVEAIARPAPEPGHVGVPQHGAPVVEAL